MVKNGIDDCRDGGSIDCSANSFASLPEEFLPEKDW